MMHKKAYILCVNTYKGHTKSCDMRAIFNNQKTTFSKI